MILNIYFVETFIFFREHPQRQVTWYDTANSKRLFNTNKKFFSIFTLYTLSSKLNIWGLAKLGTKQGRA